MGCAESDNVDVLATAGDEESLALLRPEVDVEEITAGFLGPLGAAIPVVCEAFGGYDSEKELSSSNTCALELRELLSLPSEKTAEITCEAKFSTEETS